jgi:hypothetical protein
MCSSWSLLNMFIKVSGREGTDDRMKTGEELQLNLKTE